MNRSSAIGVFDSGLGGLSVVKELRRVLPGENIVYLGDTARVPYGTRSKEAIVGFSLEDARFLLGKDIKCMVIACNTASAVAADVLKKKIKKIPVFDVITPASSKALGVSKKRRIGVIGTSATVASGKYERIMKAKDGNVRVFSRACGLFVPFIEEGKLKGDALLGIAREYLRPFGKDKIDTLVLGCTHYPIIKGVIGKALGKKVVFVNPGKEVASVVKDYLMQKGLLRVSSSKPLVKYYVTDLSPGFFRVREIFLGKSMGGKVEKVSVG